MNETEIPTPRTDAFKIQQNRLNQSISPDNWPWQAFDSILNFARQLERENAAMRAALQLAEASLGHLKQRDWFKGGVKNDVVCTLNADLVRLTLTKLKPYLP
jgi:hypothetical protein